MKPIDLVSLRKRAEDAVTDMDDGPLKVKAFEVILESLLRSASPQQGAHGPSLPIQPAPSEIPSSLAARITLLAGEAFFELPRSLVEIQESLAAHGWHYPQSNLSTPLVRLVIQRRLRRLKL